MLSLGVVRWDPKSRAGAVAVRQNVGLDIKAMQSATRAVGDWARYQNLAGEVDNVETSPVTGTYDWKSYIHEETHIARRRAEESKPAPKKAPALAPPPAPSVFYA